MGFEGTSAGQVLTFNRISGFSFAWCPPGSFRMGATGVSVELTTGFWIAQVPLTQGQYNQMMTGDVNNEPSTQFPCTDDLGRSPNHPRYYLSYNDAGVINGHASNLLREAGELPSDWLLALPTEAQWEYACRAGSTGAFCFGDDASRLGEYAWFDQNSNYRLNPVRMKRPNSWNLYDMHGNIAEICRDGYSSFLPGGRDPLVSPSGISARINRGGQCSSGASQCGSAARASTKAEARLDWLGFRPVIVRG